MAHSNGRIYIDPNSTGVEIADLQQVLGRSTGDLGQLCSDQEAYIDHYENEGAQDYDPEDESTWGTPVWALRPLNPGRINKWAKYKPIRSIEKAFVTLAQRIAAGHGFSQVSPLSWSVIQSNDLPDSFEYLPPRGMGAGLHGEDEWFRIFDFCHIESDLSQLDEDGYNHNALPPIDWFLHIDGMEDAKELSFNIFYRSLSDVKVRAKYRIGNQCSIGSPGNIEISLDQLTFYTGSGSVGNVGSQFKICVTNFASGALHSAEAPKVLNVLTDTGSGVGFEIDLSSVMPGGGGQVWPQDQDTGYSFYPRLKDKDTSTYWSAIIGSPLRITTYLFNPLAINFNGAIAFYDGAPDSGGTLFAQFTPDGNAVKITSTGVAGATVTWTSNNLYVRFYSIRITNSDNANIGCAILGDLGGVEVTVGSQTIASNGATGGNPTFTVPANGSYTIGGMGAYKDFSFGQQSLTFTSGGGSATDKRASFAAPTIIITTLAAYSYVSGQRLYYY